jgi:hypothetical protein
VQSGAAAQPAPAAAGIASTPKNETGAPPPSAPHAGTPAGTPAPPAASAATPPASASAAKGAPSAVPGAAPAPAAAASSNAAGPAAKAAAPAATSAQAPPAASTTAKPADAAPATGAKDAASSAATQAKAGGAPAASTAAAVEGIEVQVGAFSKLVNAVSLKDSLKAEFPTARIDEFRSSGGALMYRVRVGPFASRADAIRAEERLRALGHQPVRYDGRDRAG